MQQTSRSKIHVYGTSSGAIRAGAYAQGDRQFVILPYTAHSPGYSNNRHLLWYAARNFLAAPSPAVS